MPCPKECQACARAAVWWFRFTNAFVSLPYTPIQLPESVYSGLNISYDNGALSTHMATALAVYASTYLRYGANCFAIVSPCLVKLVSLP